MIYKFFDKKTFISGNKNGNILKKELAKKLHNQFLENLRREKYSHLLKTIFGVMVLLIHN